MGLSRRGNAAIHGKREQMRAGLRLAIAYAAGAFALSPAPALAQEAPPATTNTPAADAVGPRELQGFSLKGTVTRQSDQPAQAPATTRPSRSPPQANAAPAQSRTATSTPARPAPVEPRPTETASAPSAPRQRVEPRQQSASSTSAAPAPSTSDQSSGAASSAPLTSAAATAAPAFAPEPASLDLTPEHKFSVFPWLLAALALGMGGAFLFWRNRTRHAFAGGPQIDAFVAPEPAPTPRPAPPPPKVKAPPPPPSSSGIVSTRLRPWIDIAFNPARCVLDNEKFAIDFELELFNSGSAPARAVLMEGRMFNAGPTQDQDIGVFFANPVGEGDRIAAIPPLKRVSVRAQVLMSREQLQAFEAAGRQLIVPLIAFNVLYAWSGGEGQTSVGYLLGIDTKGDKMGPFRIDLGPRIFRSVAGRLLPTGVRS
jgi:hypothetical protein